MRNLYTNRELLILLYGGIISAIIFSVLNLYSGFNSWPSLLIVGVEYLGYNDFLPFPLGLLILALSFVYWIGIISLFVILRKREKFYLVSGLSVASLLTVLSIFLGYNHGDFLGNGFPVAFWRGVWGIGYSYYFWPPAFVQDVIFYFGTLTSFFISYSLIAQWRVPFWQTHKLQRTFLISGFLIIFIGGFAYDASHDYRIKRAYQIREEHSNNALESGNVELCQKIKNHEFRVTSCIRDVATKDQKPEYCNIISDSFWKQSCVFDVYLQWAKDSDDLNYCDKTYIPDGCRRNVYKELKSSVECSGFQEMYVNECMQYINEANR